MGFRRVGVRFEVLYPTQTRPQVRVQSPFGSAGMTGISEKEYARGSSNVVCRLDLTNALMGWV